MHLPRAVSALIAPRQAGQLVPDDYCQPECPSCKTAIGAFDTISSCTANSSFLTNCGSCQQCIITSAIVNGTQPSSGLETDLMNVVNLCANTTVEPQVQALQSQASRIEALAAQLTASATSTSASETGITAAPTSTSISTSVPVNSTVTPSAASSSTGSSLNSSWIAGPVMGSILGLATVFVVIFFTRRRQRQLSTYALPHSPYPVKEPASATDFRDDASSRYSVQDKAQLHSESVVVGELDNCEVVPPVELPALEPVGSELISPRSANEEGATRREEWPLPVSPLRAIFRGAELRDGRLGDEEIRHETYYHA